MWKAFLDSVNIKYVLRNYTLFQIVKAADDGKLATLLKSSLEAAPDAKPGPLSCLVIKEPLCNVIPV